MDNRHINRCLASLVIGDTQSKAMVCWHKQKLQISIFIYELNIGALGLARWLRG